MTYPKHLSARDVSRLRQAGINGSEAGYYRDAGVTTVDDMITFRTAGIDGRAADYYREAKISTLDDIITLHQAGITGWAARYYFGAGVTTLDDMTTLRKAGIDAREAYGYIKAGISTVDDMLTLRKAGVDAREAYGYIKAGISTADGMVRLTNMGCTPDDCENINQARRKSGDAAADRVLAVGEDLNRFPVGTLTALSRPSRLAEDLLAASDHDLQVAVVLAEDQYASTGKVSVPFIRQSIGIL